MHTRPCCFCFCLANCESRRYSKSTSNHRSFYCSNRVLQAVHVLREHRILFSKHDDQLVLWWYVFGFIGFFAVGRARQLIFTISANCQANPSFIPVASGGDGDGVQFWFVGYDPTLKSVIVSHQGTDASEMCTLLLAICLVGAYHSCIVSPSSRTPSSNLRQSIPHYSPESVQA